MYEPTMDPQTWIDNYAMAMDIVNASDLICARYLPLMLGGSARTWINNVPRDSIDWWKDMTRAFVKNFEGTCNRPASIEDLHAVSKGKASRLASTWDAGATCGTRPAASARIQQS